MNTQKSHNEECSPKNEREELLMNLASVRSELEIVQYLSTEKAIKDNRADIIGRIIEIIPQLREKKSEIISRLKMIDTELYNDLLEISIDEQS